MNHSKNAPDFSALDPKPAEDLPNLEPGRDAPRTTPPLPASAAAPSTQETPLQNMPRHETPPQGTLESLSVRSDSAQPTTVSPSPPKKTTPPTNESTEEKSDEAALEPATAGLLLPHWIRDSLSWMASLAVHMAILLALGLWVFHPEAEPESPDLVSIPSLEDPLDFEEEIDPQPFESPEEMPEIEVAEVPQPETENIEEETEFSLVDDTDAAAVQVDLADLSDNSSMKSDLLLEVGAYQGTGLSGRGKASRKLLVAKKGGNAGSEKAVASALKWLAAHQRSDGSWNFDLSGPCQGRCKNAGSFDDARNGATALALLPFLGAGQTHKEGRYQETVYKGLYYLISTMKVTSRTGSLSDPDGRMYSHGLAAIALSEAYAMTRDRELEDPAQLALNYIMYAQDPHGGGWRYRPRQPGDTSVLGWQIMALKSGSMAYLQIDKNTIQKAYGFLDSVQTDSGAAYGYLAPGKGSATTAVGLLSRMYMGWSPDTGALNRGVNRIAGRGPKLRAYNSKAGDDMYYNYYATQVMFQHTGAKGPKWKKWNTAMRDTLIKTQAQKGHETGSWMMGGKHTRQGGRLYCTAMATMILEVYYRHMPIFRRGAIEDDFLE